MPFVGVFSPQYYRLQDDYTFTPKLLNHFNAGFTIVPSYKTETFREGSVQSRLVFLRMQRRISRYRWLGFQTMAIRVTSLDPRAYQPGGSTFSIIRMGDKAQFSQPAL